jgi:hypothetical protein
VNFLHYNMQHEKTNILHLYGDGFYPYLMQYQFLRA